VSVNSLRPNNSLNLSVFHIINSFHHEIAIPSSNPPFAVWKL
jgi:hypothetical protein